MPLQEELNRRVKVWLKVKKLERIPAQSPYVNVPDFPDPGSVHLKTVPKLTASVKRLDISRHLGQSVSALASLISMMKRSDAENLYNEMSTMKTPLAIDDVIAEKWFTVCHNLNDRIMATSVTGFFRLVELQGKKDFQMDLSFSLACWYKVLASNQIQNVKDISILLELADKFPDRFAFVCVRAVAGGEKLFVAIKNFLLEVNTLDLNPEEASSLLDFTMETGWLLEKQDHDQLWKIISQKGSRIQGRLSGRLVPMSSIRFLAGLLRGIEETGGIDSLLSRERIHRAMSLFKTTSRKRIEQSFLLYPEVVPLIDHQIKLDLAVEAISHGITESNQSELGYSVAIFLNSVPGGISFATILLFLSADSYELSRRVLEFVGGLVSKTPEERRLKPAVIVRFYSIVSRIFPTSTAYDRTSLKAFHRVLTELDRSLTVWAVTELENAFTMSDVTHSSILSATSLLLRASSDDASIKENLSRIVITGRLLDILPPADRTKALSGLAPLWVETLLTFDMKAQEKVQEFISQINDVNNRNRYLENVVTRLLTEVHPDDPVFEDCLAFAVSGYNSSGAIDTLREIEHRVFKKVFRAGGRVEVVDGLIVDLLAVPGLEGEKTGQLISGIQSICDRFSRLAVWEEKGDSLFNDFVVNGVGKILRATVDNSSSLDWVNRETIENLLTRLIPDGSSLKTNARIVNPGGTALTFFSSILPDSIYLFSREADSLPAFLYEIADEFSRSVGGMAAGEDFAKYLVTRLDFEIQQDCVSVLGSWLSQKTPPPLGISQKWSNQRRQEWNTLKIREDTARMKLYSAVSALTSSSGSQTKEAILDTAGYLSKRIEKAGISGAGNLSLSWNRKMMEELIALSGGVTLLDCFKGDVSTLGDDPELFTYLESIDGFMEQDIFHAWRQAALPLLLNCSIDIVLISGDQSELAAQIAETAADAMEFLGYGSADSFLSTLQESLRHATGPENAFELMERKFLLPLWKRNSAERLDLLVLGMNDSRILTDILQERLSLEERVGGKIKFMRNYATFFITVEKALLEIQSDFEKSRIADGLMESWIFSGVGSCSHKPVSEISETSDLVKDIFRRIKYGSGIVSATEAGEISADMRKKYRDNADSVAIILRWTIDPAREGLLQLLEENQLLLQAAGTDAELMRLLDIHGARRGFLRDAKPYSEEPSELKRYLQALPAMVEQE